MPDESGKVVGGNAGTASGGIVGLDEAQVVRGKRALLLRFAPPDVQSLERYSARFDGSGGAEESSRSRLGDSGRQSSTESAGSQTDQAVSSPCARESVSGEMDLTVLDSDKTCDLLPGLDETLSPVFDVAEKEITVDSLPEDHALIKIIVAGVSMSDVKCVRGLMPFVHTPITPGRDYCGQVIAGPKDWIGKMVYGSGGRNGYLRDGSFAQHLVVSVKHLALKPAKLSVAESGTLGVPYLTAYRALVTRANVSAGQVVCVFGANGSVGRAALCLAKQRGATTVALVRRKGLDKYLGRADKIINTSGLASDEVTTAIVHASEKAGCDVFLDCVGGESTCIGLSSLCAHGRLVMIASPSPTEQVSFNIFQAYRKEITIMGVNTIFHGQNSDDEEDIDDQAAKIFTELAPLFDSGDLDALEVNRSMFSLREVARAIDQVGKGSRTRIAVLPFDSL